MCVCSSVVDPSSAEALVHCKFMKFFGIILTTERSDSAGLARVLYDFISY